jgi:autotransporter passenger strand-loop-strand repeat protein
MTTIVVSSGVVSSGLVISRGNELIIESGGTALSATVADGGTILDQGTVLATMVASGGYLEAVGGIVSGGTIGAGGTANVAYFTGGDNSSGIFVNPVAAVVSTVVDSGGVLLAAANVSGAVIQSGGFLFESAGFIYEPISGVIVQSGGLAVYIDEVYYPPNPGGTGLFVSQGVIEIGTNGGTNLGLSAANLAVASGQELVVLSSGFVFGLEVASGASVSLVGGDTISAVTVDAGADFTGSGYVANLQIYGWAQGAFALSGAVVHAGGVLEDSGTYITSATGIVVNSGGLVITDANVSGTIVESGGVLSGVGVNNGDVLQSGAIEILTGESISAEILSGATVLVSNYGILSGANVQSGALIVLLDHASAYNISGGGQVVSSGVIIVSGGDHVVVNPPADTVIGSGAVEYVSSGGVAVGVIINDGGSQNIVGGTAQATVLMSGGIQLLSSGVAYGTLISSGASLTVDGGTALNAIIGSGGLAEVFDGGTALSTSVGYDGNIFEIGGLVSGTIVQSGGLDLVGVSGAIGAVVQGGGSQIVANGGGLYGVAVSTFVRSGGVLYNEALTSGVTVASGGVELVAGAGVADATEVQAGGFLLLVSGGAASGVSGGGSILSGGILLVSGGTAILNPAGQLSLSGQSTEYVIDSAVASGVEIGSGAQQVVFASAINTVVDGGGQILSAGVAFNTDIVSGLLYVGSSLGSGTATVVPGGTAYNVEIGGGGTLGFVGGAISGAVVFSGAGGVLDDSAVTFNNSTGALERLAPLPVLSGFSSGDNLILPFELVSGTSPVVSGGTIVFDDINGLPGSSFSVTLADDAADNVTFTQLSNGTTEVEVTALCFLAGTMIDTPGGEMPVERLAIGDLVTTRAGPRPVKWLGRRAYGRRFVADKPMAAPVCIAAGALGTDIPRRDLYVSPGHGVLVEGQLVPAWRLINGVSITQPVPVADVFYTHIELQDHAVVYAEGAAAETFLEEALRGRFQNAAEYYALYPGPVADRENCFPRLEEGFLLQTLWQRVAKRAGVGPRALTGRLTGALEASGPGWAVGWALDEDDPRQPVCLNVMVHGVPVRRVLANRYRPDLRARGLGDGACGFAVELPPHLCGPISLRRSEDHALLAA